MTIEGMCLLEMDVSEPDNFRQLVYEFCHIGRGTCPNGHANWWVHFLEMEEYVHRQLDAPSKRRKQQAKECGNPNPETES